MSSLSPSSEFPEVRVVWVTTKFAAGVRSENRLLWMMLSLNV